MKKGLIRLLRDLWGVGDASTNELKSYLSRDVRKALRFPMERKELIEISRKALIERVFVVTGKAFSRILPYVVALVAILFSWKYCRRKHLNPKWVMKEAVLNVLNVFQFCMMLGAILSWVQHAWAFPRIAVDMVTRPVYHSVLTLIPFDSDIIRPFLPLVCGYLIRRLHEKVLFSTLDIQKINDGITIEEEEEEEDKEEEELPNFTFSTMPSSNVSSPQKNISSTPILAEDISSTPILAEGGREQIFEDALADMSSYVCKKCNGIVAIHRREAHEKYWCQADDEFD